MEVSKSALEYIQAVYISGLLIAFIPLFEWVTYEFPR